MPRLTVDVDGLEAAFKNNAPTIYSYFNLVNGDVTRFVEGMIDPYIHARIRIDPTYVKVPAVPARVQYQWLQAFIDSVTQAEVRADLARAITATAGPGAFGRFKRILEECPPERERWWAFRRYRVRAAINRWLFQLEHDPLPAEPERATPAHEDAPPPTTRDGEIPARPDVPSNLSRSDGLTATDLRERVDALARGMSPGELEALNDIGDFLLRARRVRQSRAMRSGV